MDPARIEVATMQLRRGRFANCISASLLGHREHKPSEEPRDERCNKRASIPPAPEGCDADPSSSASSDRWRRVVHR